MEKVAVITGAGGGIGLEIVRGVARDGYRVVMICRSPEAVYDRVEEVIRETGNDRIDLIRLDFTSLREVGRIAVIIGKRYGRIDLLMNNAGTIATTLETTPGGFERTVGVNYIGPYLFTRKLANYMGKGSRIVNMISCTYRFGRIELPYFFLQGRSGNFRRLSVYSNTKLALLLFTRELAERLKEKGIAVNASDPGVVSTNMITMNKWFDPLTDLFFRPFIRKPEQGAVSALRLLLKAEYAEVSGFICTNRGIKKVPLRYRNHPVQKELWEATEKRLKHLL